MIGQKLSHYTIVEKIGAGGMGEVYRAQDEHLARDVAIKVLPTGMLADEAARKRFRKEAQALSKLNHPHIATVHDFDTQEGVDFLVMEHIPGTTLTEKLGAGPLAEKEVLRLGAQLADGLAAAHAEGVLHRDLKPGNLRLTADARLKILDFSLAKLFGPASNEALTVDTVTETQALAGTLPYMAPEQLRGEKADARSDIYSAGVVLYEMATGRRPFEEKLSTALADAILHREPRPPGGVNRNVSPGLDSTILKCLEKDPESRYQSARELLVDLRRLAAPGVLVSPWPGPRGSTWWAVRLAGLGLAAVAVLLGVRAGLNVEGVRGWLFAPATPKVQSLAVLPLKNLSGDPEQDYFVEGIQEVLITELSRIGALRVISRTSAMRYKNTDKSIPEIAQELKVDAVVEGSVLRAGNRVRVTAQLIGAVPEERQLWAESYERDLGDILELQSAVARAIAPEIHVKLTPQEEARLTRRRRVNPEAHEAYLKGLYYWNRYEYPKALQSFQRAIQADPGYAVAYVGLADTYYGMSGILMPPSEATPKSRAAALKALELDDSLAEAYACLGITQMSYDRNWSAAQEALERAIDRNPNYAAARQWYGSYLLFTGRFSEALREYRTAEELDPLSPMMASWRAYALYVARRHDEAIQQAQRALELEADFFPAHLSLGLPYEQKGMLKEAIAEYEKAIQLSPENEVPKLLRAHALVKVGRRAEASQVLEEVKRRVARNPAHSCYHIAVVHLALGDREEALQWLEKAYAARSEELLLVKVDPLLDDLHSDPRFQELLRRMNFPE